MPDRKILTISARSWHGRAWHYWVRQGHHAWTYSYNNPVRQQENLCHYVRVVLLWAPLRWMAYERPLRRAMWLRPWMPVSAVVVGTALWDVVGAVAAMVVLLSLMTVALLSLIAVGTLIQERHDQRVRRRGGSRSGGDSFGSVLVDRVRAKKARVCPFVDIKGEVDRV